MTFLQGVLKTLFKTSRMLKKSIFKKDREKVKILTNILRSKRQKLSN